MEEGKSPRRSAKDVDDLITLVDHAARKVRLITEVFGHDICDENLLSDDARAGFHFILNDLEDDLEFIIDQYYHGLNRPITEKTEAT